MKTAIRLLALWRLLGHGALAWAEPFAYDPNPPFDG